MSLTSERQILQSIKAEARVYRSLYIHESDNIRTAFQRLEATSQRILLVVDRQDRFLGTLSDGDLRRYVLQHSPDLDVSIDEIYNRDPIVLTKGYSLSQAKDYFLRRKVQLLPVLNEEGYVVDCVSWSNILMQRERSAFVQKNLSLPVVIMAGGKGTRLAPFTRILPKPLIPIGDLPIVEVIIREFYKQGADEFYLTLNHKAEMIQSYFEGIEKDYKLNYIREDQFLGTAGSLKLFENRFDKDFLVTNCDVIVRVDYADVLQFHRNNRSDMTILSPIQQYKIPYGILEFDKEGNVLDILEKPQYTFTINGGVYVLNKSVLDYIPADTHFDMTDLMRNLIENNKQVMMYPLQEDKYIDIGQWEEYRKVVERFNIMSF